MRMRYIVVTCGLSGSAISFLHYIINGGTFERKLLNTKGVFWFSEQLLSATFLILRLTEQIVIKKGV